MRTLSNFVSLHPYFKVHPGKLEGVKAGLPRFVEETATEKDCLFYGFTSNGEEMFCREAYQSAECLLAHVENIDALLAEMLKMADLTQIGSDENRANPVLSFSSALAFVLTPNGISGGIAA